MTQPLTERLLFHDMEPDTSCLYDDVVNGLSRKPRSIPPKYFYDEQGSRLFDAICETLEYYPTRTEISIIKENLGEICAYLGKECILIEPGSGASQKVRLLLDALEPHTYVPLDISSNYLYSIARNLVSEYPRLNVVAACVDYTAPINLPDYLPHKRRVAFFPGSSIGNFEPEEAVLFLNNVLNLVRPDGCLLVGVDLKKSPDTLNRAYNDAQGITAAFNLNILTHINRELNTDFNIDGFEHKAFYNELPGRVEMHLVSKTSQAVTLGGKVFEFKRGESIHTENSYKYSVSEFHSLARRAGFSTERTWTDRNGLFSIHYLKGS
ncbi:hypothetical protein MNBD_GAMMA14-276 [hydrothermal vent metagenome]|uniref:Histidine-specific methyltransferase SAM-dependent domain-containing protein n=1 Tax=hydrothermal vent metagenome TaxID=652676 RepID=A0A3B0YQP7_9ZZZZ